MAACNYQALFLCQDRGGNLEILKSLIPNQLRKLMVKSQLCILSPHTLLSCVESPVTYTCDGIGNSHLHLFENVDPDVTDSPGRGNQ